MKLLFLEDHIAMPVMKLPVVALHSRPTRVSFWFLRSSFHRISFNGVELGEVTAIVSPSLIHSLFIKKACKRFPKAEVWAPPGMREKFPEMKVDKILTQDPWPYQDQIDMQLVSGVKKVRSRVLFERVAHDTGV
ncbi:MAG: hypothetical protein R2877_03650 [Bdellovibrionota bacterium]